MEKVVNSMEVADVSELALYISIFLESNEEKLDQHVSEVRSKNLDKIVGTSECVL